MKSLLGRRLNRIEPMGYGQRRSSILLHNRLHDLARTLLDPALFSSVTSPPLSGHILILLHYSERWLPFPFLIVFRFYSWGLWASLCWSHRPHFVHLYAGILSFTTAAAAAVIMGTLPLRVFPSPFALHPSFLLRPHKKEPWLCLFTHFYPN